MKVVAIAAVFTVGFGAGLWTATHAQQPTSQLASLPAERVTGIGGVFFKAKDPKALAVWYRQTLGVDLTQGFAKFSWREQDSSRAGSTAWSLFPSTSTYFPSALMINYRVRNLDAMLTQVRALGVSFDGKITEDANGRFAWIVDPEGNKVELWEPK